MKRCTPLAARALSAMAQVAALFLIALFGAPLFSQESAEMPVERPMISTGVDAEAIARNRPDTAVWLTDAGERRVLALFHPEQALPVKGALVILADEGVSAAAGLADALREPLSRDGWAVMTLGLSSPPFEVQQWLHRQSNARPDVTEKPADEKAEEGQSESSVMINLMETASPNDALKQYRSEVGDSLDAALNALNEREYQRIVLVGIGRATGHLIRQAGTDGPAPEMIWIAPHFYPDESSTLTDLLAAAPSLSILELYSTLPGDRTLDRSAAERAAALKRAGVDGYRRQPVAMSRQPQPREAGVLANRISAWLRNSSQAK